MVEELKAFWAVFVCTSNVQIKTKWKKFIISLYFTGKIRTHGIGGGHKQKYRWIDFQRLRYEPNEEAQPFEEKVVQVRYDPCR